MLKPLFYSRFRYRHSSGLSAIDRAALFSAIRFGGGHGTDSKDIQPLVENPCKCYLRNRTVFLFRELLAAGKPFIVVFAAISTQRNIVQMFLRVIGACESS